MRRVIIGFLALTLMASAAVLVSASPATAGGEGYKATICHVPPGNPYNAHLITVNTNSFKGHELHRDWDTAGDACVCTCLGEYNACAWDAGCDPYDFDCTSETDCFTDANYCVDTCGTPPS